ncbi:MAG: type III-B CRISPR module RAMP protein Cmr1 [Verrucomicrobiae bacterium]|nr:type III-B CRISPR module RAMP protein Cmr1 [Verrucomicrobiae bacterium]
MKTEIYNLKFLTPCFCGGADPSIAELRPSAIRGQLRWWFRAIGGTREEETEIFGGAEKEKGRASAVIVRASILKNTGNKDWSKVLNESKNINLTYLLIFFCKDSRERRGRLHNEGAIPPETQFDVTLIYRREIPDHLREKFELALRAFFSIGAIGYRATRTAGAFTYREPSKQLTSKTWENLQSDLEMRGFKLLLYPSPFNKWIDLCNKAGDFLKNKLRGSLNIKAGQGGKIPNILGCSDPRQASVLHLRPTIIDGRLRLLLIEAPHARIIGKEVTNKSRSKGQIIPSLKRQLI